MPKLDEDSNKVMAAAMRFVKSGDRAELEKFSLTILKHADYQLSNRDLGSGYRRAISDRIAELTEGNQECQREDLIDVKPNFFGLGVNLNEAWKRLQSWLKK